MMTPKHPRTKGRKRVTLEQISERLDSIETLINRVWASLPDKFTTQPACPNGSCGTCGKCLPVMGCQFLNCPGIPRAYSSTPANGSRA